MQYKKFKAQLAGVLLYHTSSSAATTCKQTINEKLINTTKFNQFLKKNLIEYS